MLFENHADYYKNIELLCQKHNIIMISLESDLSMEISLAPKDLIEYSNWFVHKYCSGVNYEISALRLDPEDEYTFNFKICNQNITHAKVFDTYDENDESPELIADAFNNFLLQLLKKEHSDYLIFNVDHNSELYDECLFIGNKQNIINAHADGVPINLSDEYILE